jgi:hypothetical protein
MINSNSTLGFKRAPVNSRKGSRDQVIRILRDTKNINSLKNE